MIPEIATIETKLLVGQSIDMSLMQNKTAQLWSQFSPRIKEIKHRTDNDKVSMQLYPPSYFKAFNPATEFIKWATVEVADFDHIPDGMKTYTLLGGLYAVFYYQGLSTDSSVFQYIYSEWLPKSDYQLDNRPHFEVLGEKYKNNDPKSEEDIWVPIMAKSKD